jgi:hypothetical protein
MRPFRQLGFALAILCGAAFAAVGQTNPTVSSSLSGGRVIVPERPTAVDANVTSFGPSRPLRPERPALPPEVSQRIDRFKLDARAYMEQQEALKKSLVGANEQERQAIRLQIHALREKWLEQVREMRKEYKDRLPELRQKLAGHSEVLDSVRNSARNQLKEMQQETKPRRGDD